MQFRGELSTPADENRGVPVSLLVDEYHLEIKSGEDLLGRWFLADVEVDRVAGSTFKLYLGDDEAEFVAEDALKFAYEGVTAMQEAWVRLRKGRRRHMKAAASKVGKVDRDREIPAPVSYANAKRSAAAPAKRTAQARAVEVSPPLAPPIMPARVAKAAKPAKPAKDPKPAKTSPQAPVKVKSPAPAKPSRQAPAAAKAVVANGRPGLPLRTAPAAVIAAAAPPLIEVDDRDRELEPAGATVRFATDGHHPAETNKGLMSIFRKEQKPPHGHVHRFEDGRTVGGITRRVCVQCAYVSISVGEE
jgi:hypothetical protein